MMRVFSHGDCCGRYPENPVLAFQKAVETGCDGIELDVQMTKDGGCVILRDETFDRTADGTDLYRENHKGAPKHW